MDANAVQVCVRPRPWHTERELPYLTQPSNQSYFLGDGNFGCSPRRPAAGSIRGVVEVIDHRQLDFDKPEEGSESKRGQPGAKRYKNRRYVFDQVLQMDATQETVYEKTSKPLLDGVLDGYNATVFAYGATGCGKTHTISGTAEDPGVTIRLMRELYERIEDSKDKYETYIEVSMVEVYNEIIRDLLSDDFQASPTGGLKLLENEKERVRIDKVTLRRPTSVEQVMDLVLLGTQRRSTSSTASNSVSSRSHAVLQISVGRNSRGHDVDFAQEVVRQRVSSATLSIIDLAGSERAAATTNMGARMKEGANINKSLLALSSCIKALCTAPVRGVKPHVPYRNSKLTRLLKFSLGGNCRTVMICCVSPSSRDIEDTHNTLSWANTAKAVSTKISRNTAGLDVSVAQYLRTIAEKEQQIKYLEKKLLEGRPEMSAYQKKKLEQSRMDANSALGNVRGEVTGSLAPIQDGALLRALWDGAGMRIAALERRCEGIDQASGNRSDAHVEREKRYLQSLIRQQENAYKNNAEIQSSIQREAAKADMAEKLFKTTEQRTFGDGLEKYELDVFRLNITLQREHMAKNVASAREKGYRQVIQGQAEEMAQMAGILDRITAALFEEARSLSDRTYIASGEDRLEKAALNLRTLASSGEFALSSIFGAPSSLANSLPALPQPSLDQPAKLGLLSRRQSTAPISIQKVIQPASNVKRVHVPVKTQASPSRLARVAASPRKQPLRPILVVSREPGQSRKPLQWRDEAGKGEIDDSAIAPAARVFTSSSSNSSISPQQNGSSDTSGEWDDEPDELAEQIKRGTLPLIPPPIRTSKVVNPLSTTSSSVAPPVPAWKKNRMLMGKTFGALGSLGEETAEQSSPEAGPSQPKSGSMGPPIRPIRGPLLERHQVPQMSSSIFSASTSSSSTLFKPTAASAARAASIFPILNPSTAQSTSPSRRISSVGRAPINALKAARRASNAGPYKRSRSSILPLPAGSSSGMESSFSSASIPTPIFPLSGGPRRVAQEDVTSGLPTTDSNRRMSTLPSAPGLSRPSMGPRPSLSMNFNPGTLPRAPSGGGVLIHTLSSRPSISRLSTFGSVAGLAGAGDNSRAQWR